MDIISVLIVEDENIVALDLKNTLFNLKYNVVGVTSTAAGAIIKANELRPDIILMDIMLKGDMDGIEAAREINSRLNIPIVYLSAYSDKNTLDRVNKTNFYSYISKPFDEFELSIKLRIAVYCHKLKKKYDNKLSLIYDTFNNINYPIIILDKDNKIKFINSFFSDLSIGDYSNFLDKKIYSIIPSFNKKSKFCDIFNKKWLQFFYENEEAKIVLLKDYLNKDFIEYENKVNEIGYKLNDIFLLIMGNIELCKIKSDTQNYEYYELLKDTQKKFNLIKDISNNLLGYDNNYYENKIIDLKYFILEKFYYIRNLKFSEETSFEINMSSILLFKVLNSVIKNSFEAINDSGIVSIDIYKENSNIIINIIDNGIGIEPKNKNRVFEPFFTTKKNNKGLGLIITKSILKKYNSNIILKSSNNGETIFTISIPEYK